MKKEEFIQAFQQQYGGYICVSNEVVGNFYDTFYQGYHNVDRNGRCYTDECILDLCKDYILSQGLAIFELYSDQKGFNKLQKI